jgi:DNA-binding transcriptional MerR regulator/methylmalonyl-CoA mutase cobalamin-binding subunit
MKLKKLHPIRYVARQTGLSSYLIRVWEKRYKAVVPERTETNRRLYSDADILRLQMLKKAVASGHNISQVAGLSLNELMKLINRNYSRSTDDSGSLEHLKPAAPQFCEAALASVRDLDAAGLAFALEQAAVHLTRRELIESVIAPLGERIGELWRAGDMKIINEHLATPVIRAFLWELLRSTEVPYSAQRIVVATPNGNRHELGALAVALIARESGWRSLYFGTGLPSNEIAIAVASSGARAVALSISHVPDRQQLISEIQKLRRKVKADVAIFIGGQGTNMISERDDLENVWILNSLDDFKAHLDNLCAHPSRAIL